MDLKERLNRLIALPKANQESKSRVISELRERLDRVFEPRRVYPRGRPDPIEKLVKGEIIATAHGEAFRARAVFPGDCQCGERMLAELLAVPTYPAHLLSRDAQLKGLDLQRTLFLDTETTGLTGGTGTVAFMIGTGFFQGEEFHVHQLFMRDYCEEKAVLSILNSLLEDFQFLVTFNGRHYDIPLLETRFILSRLSSKIREMPNFDLLFPSRKIWKGAYENCRLITLESQLLGIERIGDIPSELIPSFYFEYLRTGNAMSIHRTFYHNEMDILTMVALLGRIHLVYHDPQAARPRKGLEHYALGRLLWDHGDREKAIPCFELALRRCDEDLAWEVMKWLSLAFKKTGQPEKARTLWEEMVAWPRTRDSFPYFELAKYYEHYVKDIEQAILYVNHAMEQTASYRQREREALRDRKRRLELKRLGNARR
jgi:uncharacterized protein YprB with RNaseH-like and TPR domain